MIQRLQEKRNEEGFTLIELLIVIIVLGILAAIVVFAVGTTRDDAAANACKTDVKAVQLAAEAYKTRTGAYPAAEADMVGGTNGLLKQFPPGQDYVRAGTAPNFTYTITPNPAVTGCSVVTG
jgi:general secretion pathway protein G